VNLCNEGMIGVMFGTRIRSVVLILLRLLRYVYEKYVKMSPELTVCYNAHYTRYVDIVDTYIEYL